MIDELLKIMINSCFSLFLSKYRWNNVVKYFDFYLWIGEWVPTRGRGFLAPVGRYFEKVEIFILFEVSSYFVGWWRLWIDQLFDIDPPMEENLSKIDRRSLIGTLEQTSYSSLGMAAPEISVNILKIYFIAINIEM